MKNQKTNPCEYRTWYHMKHRCDNPNNSQYKDYGGRGITYDPSWKTFSGFIADMGDKPIGTSIDRINNNLGYSKENCRWATRKQQQRNTRSNRHITYKGETRCLSEWNEIMGYKEDTIKDRLRQGWDELKALLTPVRNYKKKGHT